MWGSYVPVILRIFLCIIWYGVQAFTGGQLVAIILSTIFSGYHHMENTLPESAHMTTKQFVGYVIFNISELLFLLFAPVTRELTRYSLARPPVGPPRQAEEALQAHRRYQSPRHSGTRDRSHRRSPRWLPGYPPNIPANRQFGMDLHPRFRRRVLRQRSRNGESQRFLTFRPTTRGPSQRTALLIPDLRKRRAHLGNFRHCSCRENVWRRERTGSVESAEYPANVAGQPVP